MNPQTLDPLPRLILIPKDALARRRPARRPTPCGRWPPRCARPTPRARRCAGCTWWTARGPTARCSWKPGGLTVDDVKAVAPDMKVFEEQWYELERFDLMLPRLARSRAKAGAGAERLSGPVLVRAPAAPPLKDVASPPWSTPTAAWSPRPSPTATAARR